MSEQERHSSSDGELPAKNIMNTLSTAGGEEDGADGEIDEDEETNTQNVSEKNSIMRRQSSRGIDGIHKTAERHRTSLDNRHHHSNSHRDRRRRSSPRSNIVQNADDDNRSQNERLKQRTDNMDDSVYDHTVTDRSSRLFHRKHNSCVNHSHVHPEQAKQNNDGESSEIQESSSTHTKDHITSSKKLVKKNKHSNRMPMKDLAETCEAEDGEILEDGELEDDMEATVKRENEASRNFIQVSKSSNRDTNKEVNLERRKSDHKNKRRHETDMKKKRKYADVDNLEDENNPTPAWGTGYQGAKKRVPTSGNNDQRMSAGMAKCYQRPLGLCDSPSYSGDSDQDLVPKLLLTEGYIDSSVAADEKEGIFNHKVNLTKKNKRHFERNDHKRGRNLDNKFEGPPKKKTLVDMTMSKRPACRFYLEGKCAKGILCQFNHDVEKPKKMEVCKYHLTVRGCVRDKCPYMHEDFPCKYYHTGAKCYSGDNCKFSHDSLTEGSRKALEMRVAAEDIVNMHDPDYNEFKSREPHNKPSLLGSPPRFRTEVRKIPSLFEIEVHPPGQRSPQTSRPSGFYSETNMSPNPGIGVNTAGGSGSVSNMGIMNSAITSNQSGQHVLSNQTNIGGGPGLLQTPTRSHSMLYGPASNNRAAMMMGNQQQRHCGGSSNQFIGHGQISNNSQQEGNLPPVLNMLGAIIREAAMQKGSGVHNNNMLSNIGMGLNSIHPNMNSMALNMNNVRDNINMVQNSSVIQNNMSDGMSPNNFGPTNIGLGIIGNMDRNNIKGNIGPNNNVENTDSNMEYLSDSNSNKNITMKQQNIEHEKDSSNMDTDYRINNNFEEIKEESQDLLELDQIRQQIQAQIDKEDETETDAPENRTEEVKVQIKDEQPTSDKSEDSQENEDLEDNTATAKEEVEHIEIPSHLPKKQKELFKRIQQQQLLREKEWDKQETSKSAGETETKAEVDDWYSSDEDDKKAKPIDVLNKKPSTTVAGSLNVSSSEQTTTPSTASTFNIMQMINTIKSQSATSTPASTKFSLVQDSHQLQENISSMVSPQAYSSFRKLSGAFPCLPNLQALTVDPVVVNAIPVKPLVYAVVKISLNISKPYAQLPDFVNATGSSFKDDPRVKWHLNYLEKQGQKEPQRQESIDGEKTQKQSDSRLAKESSDPAKPIESLGSSEGVGSSASALSVQRAQNPSVLADPRLARMTSGNVDPRLNRQNNQNVNDFMNTMVGRPMIGIGGMAGNQMGSPFNGPMRSNMEHIGYMGSSDNSIGTLANSQLNNGMNNINMDGSGRIMQYRNTSINNMGTMGNNINMGPRPMNQLCSNLFNSMNGETNVLVNLGNSNMMGSQGNNLWRGPMGQQNPLQTDSMRVDPRFNNSSDPRLRGLKSKSETHGSSDPRLRNKALGSSEQQFNTKEPGRMGIDPRSVILNSSKSSGFSDERLFGNEFKSFSGKLTGNGEHNQSSNSLQNATTTFGASGQFQMSQTRQNWAPNIDHKVDSVEQLPPTSSHMQHSNADERTLPKFDYRNNPRFKRVKKLMGQQRFGMEYNSPLSGDDMQADNDEQSSSSNNSYNSSRSFDHNPRNRNVRSPQLPDHLQDFDLPNSPPLTIVESEEDNVKDIFKTIDPTASPFC